MVQGVAAGENLSPNKRASNFAGRWLEKNQIVTDFHKDEFTAQLRDPTKLGLAIQNLSIEEWWPYVPDGSYFFRPVTVR